MSEEISLPKIEEDDEKEPDVLENENQSRDNGVNTRREDEIDSEINKESEITSSVENPDYPDLREIIQKRLSDDVFHGENESKKLTDYNHNEITKESNSEAEISEDAKDDPYLSSVSSQSEDNLLVEAVKAIDIKSVDEILLDENINVNQRNKQGLTVLHQLVKTFVKFNKYEKMKKRNDFEELLLKLVKKGFDVNAVDSGKLKQTALHILAGIEGNDDVIKTLLAIGVRVNLANARGQTALHIAANKANLQNTDALVKGGADPNTTDVNGQTPLHYAAKGQRHLEIVQLLINCGADVTVKDKIGGKLPLHLAAKCGRAEIVMELIGDGSTINTTEASGQTALHLAAANDVTGAAVGALLTCSSIKLNEKDSVYGDTPLHKIIRYQMLENLNQFKDLRRKLKVNARNHSGNTPAHLAAHCQDMSVWSTLLQLKAETGLTNDEKLTAARLALKAKNQIAIALINQYNEGQNSNNTNSS